MATELQSKILRLAAEASLAHPGKGWPEVCSENGLRDEIMKETGFAAGSFTDCLEAVGLTRAAVVDAFVLARPSMQRTVRQMMTEGYVPVTVTPPSEPEKLSTPVLKPVPCRTDAPRSEPTRESRSEPRPEAVEPPEATTVQKTKAAVQPPSKAPQKAPAKVTPRKAAAPRPVTQGTLF